MMGGGEREEGGGGPFGDDLEMYYWMMEGNFY